jgi:hypothetical protein
MTIPCQDGLVYLVRLRIIQTPWFGVYLHDIYEPDADREPHNHPWPFLSFILRGFYTERFYPQPYADLEEWRDRTWKRFTWHRMDRDSAHRIVEAAPGLKTLIICGRRHASGWGFYTDDGYVPWHEHKGGL